MIVNKLMMQRLQGFVPLRVFLSSVVPGAVKSQVNILSEKFHKPGDRIYPRLDNFEPGLPILRPKPLD